MRVFGANNNALLAARGLVKSRLLIWISALNRGTNAIETIGFWNGDDHQDFTINAVNRTYYAAGNILGFGQYTVQEGLQIRTWEVKFTNLTSEILTAVYTYDARMAPVEVHQIFLDPDTDDMLDAPEEIFVGSINKLTPVRAPIGSPSSITMELVSNARDLTRRLPHKYSHESQVLRSNDQFFQYSSVTRAVQVFWGSTSA